MASRRQCKRALDLHSESISELRNVVGLGIVPDPDKPRSHALGVYVSRKLPSSKLKSADRIPETVEVRGRGKTRHTINVQVIEQGIVELESEFGMEML